MSISRRLQGGPGYLSCPGALRSDPGSFGGQLGSCLMSCLCPPSGTGTPADVTLVPTAWYNPQDGIKMVIEIGSEKHLACAHLSYLLLHTLPIPATLTLPHVLRGAFPSLATGLLHMLLSLWGWLLPTLPFPTIRWTPTSSCSWLGGLFLPWVSW